MGLPERFFGKRDPDELGLPVANTGIAEPLSLQVLFAEPARLDPDRLTDALRSYHAGLAHAIFELDPGMKERGTLFGLAGWADHVVRVVGFDAPMPPETVERCVGPSHYEAELKDQARAHQGHALLYYVGYESDPLEQYIALAAVAGVLAAHGAIVVMNESGHTSFPAAALAGG